MSYINLKNNNGFSLFEIIIVLTIFLVAVMISTEYIINGYFTIFFGSDKESTIQFARKSLEKISKEIREARISEKGDYPILSAEPQNLIIFADINNDNKAEKVRYYLDDKKIKKDETLPGSDNNYTGVSQTSTISEYIKNDTTPVFTYLDSNNNLTSDINKIRLIHLNFIVNASPRINMKNYKLELDVQLRNLKDNL